MMNGLVMILDDNMSNLTSASNEASISSSNRNETSTTLYPPQQPFAVSPNQPPPAKKKRNLPGNPDPDAEVVALSPRTLITKNRFICEICNKGFQRDQNLQLHRRGHNLPWKLKQRTNKEVIKRKVYICPEPTCVHNDPSRALGDLTGIKKHFFRKHGEKKWKCEKCTKRYAVQSDWKAHSKICGTREYRCDCGTLFSRRDSFITHRAFCDALAEETAARGAAAAAPSTSQIFNLQHQVLHHHNFPLKTELQDHQPFNFNPSPHHLPPWLANPNPNPNPGPAPIELSTQLFSPSSDHHSSFNIHQHDHQNPNPSHTHTTPSPSLSSLLPSFQPHPPPPHMSATALLQKAAQMGVTMSKPSSTPSDHHHTTILIRPGPHQDHMSTAPPTTATAGSSSGGGVLGFSSREERGEGGGSGSVTVTPGCMQQVGATMMMTSPLPCATSGFELGAASSFEEALMNGMLNPKMGSTDFQVATFSKQAMGAHLGRNNGRGGGDGLSTRDFLGLKAFPHGGFANMAAFDPMKSSSSYDKLNQNQTPWQG